MRQGSYERPNIILILADDMGFSDIGCYGSEIRTPNLDRLAGRGLRFSQMYNMARCCPSRAALLTGLNPHQTGVGHMVRDLGYPSYRGFLNESCVTIAEVLRASGYTTLMSGKWHTGGEYNLGNRSVVEGPGTPGDDSHPLPTQRGFERYFGTIDGGGSYFNPVSLMRDERFVRPESDDFYLTDAFSDNAVSMLEGDTTTGKPFFLYLSYTAPHWPLHALEEDIARYEGSYANGWDDLRTGRHEELKGLGILDSRWPISPRHSDVSPWEEAPNREWEALRMAVYAAQIDRMDQGIGRVMAKVREMGAEDNTIVMFLSDNGGCAEFLKEDSSQPHLHRYDRPTRDGRPMTIGNIPALRPGPDDTFMSYDIQWANASNSPFRLFKHWVHEGGISTPFIVSWPERIDRGGTVAEPVQVIDIFATCIDAAGAAYPQELDGREITPLEGESFLPTIDGKPWSREQTMFWEHEGNRAVRSGQWKLVAQHGQDWELYDMEEDRTELKDLSHGNRARVQEMSKLHDEWSRRCGVLPWPISPRTHE